MDRLDKELQKLTLKERRKAFRVIEQIEAGSIDHLQIKKLKGRINMFRVRVGKIRIMYRMKNGEFELVAVRRRKDDTYRGF